MKAQQERGKVYLGGKGQRNTSPKERAAREAKREIINTFLGGGGRAVLSPGYLFVFEEFAFWQTFGRRCFAPISSPFVLVRSEDCEIEVVAQSSKRTATQLW